MGENICITKEINYGYFLEITVVGETVIIVIV